MSIAPGIVGLIHPEYQGNILAEVVRMYIPEASLHASSAPTAHNMYKYSMNFDVLECHLKCA